jgi:hypothetical protein
VPIAEAEDDGGGCAVVERAGLAASRIIEEVVTMDNARFDRLTVLLGTASTRRAGLGFLAALGLGSGLVDRAEAKKKHRKKCKKKKCGACQKCKKGKCTPQPDGTACGGGAACSAGQCICPTECCADTDCDACAACDSGQCVSTCPDGQFCQDDTCIVKCPSGQKACQGICIPDNQCCPACPSNQVCCTNVVECKDVRNDDDFCGQCANGQCPGGAFCANGACGLTCNTVGEVCFAPDCLCGSRVDPAHSGEKVCAETSPFSCSNVKTCNTDADCAPATQGFRQVCVSGLCSGKKVCADPCA